MGFKNLFNCFKKSCKSCEWYSEYRSQPKVLPDKTVIKSQLICVSCEKMDGELIDTTPCELFKERGSDRISFLHASSIYFAKKRKGSEG